MESAGPRKEIADAISSGALFNIIAYYTLSLSCFSQAITCVFYAGKWYRGFFTNGDILELLSGISAMGCEDPRKMLHTIVTSRVDTRMSQYRLYNKALSVQSQTEPRKSRRYQQCSLELAGTLTKC